MNSEPLVSIIIPFYNRFALLENTLFSVKNQDYNNFEVILIDDCSELQLEIERIEKLFQNHRVIYKRLERNSGPGTARSMGREIASGKYVAYLDSDDLWEPQFLTRTVDKLEEHPDISMAFTNVLIKNGERNITRLKIQDGIYDFYDLIFNKKKYWATAAALWRSDVSLSSNWRSLRDHEDYVHDILSLKYNPKVYHISTPLCVVNKSVHMGIKRSNEEMLKSLVVLIKDKTLVRQIKERGEYEKFISFLLWRVSKRKFSLGEFQDFHALYFKIFSLSKNKRNIIVHYFKIVCKHRFFVSPLKLRCL